MHFSPPSRPVTDKSGSEPRDVLQLLRSSQEQIRRFTALALQLGRAPGASPGELSRAADRLAHYFTQQLPRHFEAEDFALLPRLFTTPISAEMMRHLWGLKLQHDSIEHALGELVPLWLSLRDSPERYAELAESLAQGGRQLMMLMEVHMHLEEQYLFPLVRECLPQAALEELAVEVLHGRDLLN